MHLDFGKILSIVVIVFAVAGIGIFLENQMNFSQNNYGKDLSYSLTKAELGYDYSCDQQAYSLDLSLANNGEKAVSGFTISVTNALCVGAVPSLPAIFSPGQQLQIDIYTTTKNGTITVSGNSTVLLIAF